ncbi:MAG: ribonuclease III [Bacteroidales bacterium]|jgi:ribonuclease-3|nr:ribonuclease III [Bacteroidales bacterium]
MRFLFSKLNSDKQDRELEKFLRNILGCKPKNILIYKLALIHKSYVYKDTRGCKRNNERLEYLGDTVLSTIVGDFLFRKYPYQGEGFLTEMRSKIVSRSSLNKLAHRLGMSKYIKYSKDNGQFLSMDGDAFEAIVGAIYLDRGYDFAYHVVIRRIFSSYLDIDSIETTQWNFKSKLIDWGQKTRQKVSYQVIETLESNARKQYNVQVLIDDSPQETAIDFSIKAAEQLASEKTYKKLVSEGIIKYE